AVQEFREAQTEKVRAFPIPGVTA
ncbi:MAG: hypothetical protein RL180_819, partial [Pseudomonadota bacterium]